MTRIVLENEKCKPYKKHRFDAGWDLRSNNETFTICPGEKVKVYTGVKIAIPPKCAGLVVPRSGLGTSYRVTLANTIGVIDSEYRGEIIVWLINDGEEDLVIEKYDRFCQLILASINITPFEVVRSLPHTERGDGGFGHTGISD